jgi:hypothetical protein
MAIPARCRQVVGTRLRREPRDYSGRIVSCSCCVKCGISAATGCSDVDSART